MTDDGYCIPGCETCAGLGIIPREQVEGWRVCPSNPKRYNKTGVSMADEKLYDKLPQNNSVKRIQTVFKKLLKEQRGFLYLSGTPGTGKSVCSRAYTAEAIMAGMDSLYTRQSELINHLRSSYDQERGQIEYKSRLERYKTLEWLVIDEIGRDRMTDFAQESLAEIVDARYEFSRFGGVTVLVSNFAPEEIFQPYIVDRIRDMRNVVLSIQGKSLRGEK